MTNKYISISLAALVCYLLIFNRNQEPIENDTCKLLSDTGACNYISSHCDEKYYWFAKTFYCKSMQDIMILKVAYIGFVGLLVVSLLVCLSILVSSLLFPNLHEIVELLNVNDRILSMCLIPLVNVFPDILSYHVALKSGSVDLVLGQILGALFIIFTWIVGGIAFLKPFRVADPNPIILNYGLLLLIMIGLFYILSDGKITMVESISMVAAYLVYLSINLKVEWQAIEEDLASSGSLHTVLSLELPLNIEDALQVYTENSETRTRNEAPSVIGILDKLCFTIENSFHFLVPVAGSNRSFPHSEIWYLFLFILELSYHFFYFNIEEIFSLTLCFIILQNILAVQLHKHPLLKRMVVSVVGFSMSLIVVSEVSKSILRLLKNMGIIVRISDFYLGSVIFAFSNSVNDIATNITIAMTINPIFGLNACLGSPSLIILLGLGFNCLLRTIKGIDLHFNLSPELKLNSMGIIGVMGIYLFYIPLNDWKLDKRLGILVVLWWLLVSMINFGL